MYKTEGVVLLNVTMCLLNWPDNDSYMTFDQVMHMNGSCRACFLYIASCTLITADIHAS